MLCNGVRKSRGHCILMEIREVVQSARDFPPEYAIGRLNSGAVPNRRGRRAVPNSCCQATERRLPSP